MNVSYLMDPKEQQEAQEAAEEQARYELADVCPGDATYTAARKNWLSVYELDSHYGGPEEGGWWYDTGTVILSIPVHDMTIEDADNLFDLLRKAFPKAKPGSAQDRSQSIYDGGDYHVIREEQRGRSWPEERPRYE